MLLLAPLLLILSPVPAAQDSVELLTETLPDGSYVEREVERDRDGTAVNHGGYKSWWDADKRIPRATGRYEHGLKRATWRTYYPDKRRESKGKYEAGLRVGAWAFWLPDGEPDAKRSGEFTVETVEHDNGAEFARGERRDGRRQGLWTLHWPNEALMATGHYDRGQRVGIWNFRHADGTPDPDWISGDYAESVRLRPLQADQRAELGATDGDSSLADALLTPPSLGGREVDVQDTLRNLLRLDLSDAEQVAVGTRLVGLLAKATGGPTFEWRPGTAPEDATANQLSVRRWASFWTLLALDPDYISFDYPAAIARVVPVEEVTPLEQLHPPLGGSAPVPEPEALGPLAVRFDRPAHLPKSERASAAAVEAALDWLVRHQNPDGSWSAAKFPARCPEDGEACSGLGQPYVDVGVTGLSLLALMGAGNTTREGPHHRAVARGIGWLLTQQEATNDVTDGLFGQRIGHAYVYGHGIATLAVAEAALLSGNRTLLEATQQGVDLIVRARSPYGAWRYDIPPTEGSDTSITGWMLQALDAGRRAGAAVDPAALAGGLQWLEEVTDPENGRCGYDSRGSGSSRVQDKNEHFPRDSGEAMTGVSLFSRVLLGQEVGVEEALAKHAGLIRRRLPEWDPEGLGCDMYYWYYGSYGMYQVGGEDWEVWRAALERAVLGAQRVDGCAAGSWDPVGPWGFSGGRVYATAVMALCLEAPRRLGRLGE